MATFNTVKIPQPRNLEEKETRPRLDIWKTSILNYYRRDDYFRKFLTCTWDPTETSFGLANETDNLKRTPETQAGDLKVFLQVISAYLPHDYASSEIVEHSISLDDVFRIIYEMYDCDTTSVTFLDISTMKKDVNETHRQFYLRIRSHMERHLASPNIKVENTSTGSKGDTMTVSLMDMVAQHWLMRTDPRLVNIVKVEYATELRKGTRICELVPQISKCVDDLIARHEVSSANVNRVQQTNLQQDVTQDIQISRVQNTSSKLPLPKFKPSGLKSSRGFNRGKTSFNNRSRSRPICPTCSQLRSTYNLPGLDIYHEVKDCQTVKKSSIRKVDTYDEDDEEDEENQDAYEDEESGINMKTSNDSSQTKQFQTSIERDLPTINEISLVDLDLNYKKTDGILSDEVFKKEVVRLVRTVNLEVDHAKSPTLLVKCKGKMCKAIIDEGAEVNCLDHDIAKSIGLKIIPSQQSVRAAGSVPMRVQGQSEEEVVVTTSFPGIEAHINLGRLLIVKNLGSNILIGEPGKKRNRIQTIAHRRVIQMEVRGVDVKKPYLDNRYKYDRTHLAARVDKSVTIYPSESYQWPIPSELLHCRNVSLNPGRKDEKWFQPRMQNIETEEHIAFKNVLDRPIRLKRGRVFAEVRTSQELNINFVHSIPPNHSAYEKDVKASEIEPSELELIQVDPDGVLTKEERDQFHQLHLRYKELFTKAPGKYTGYFGPHDTHINFSDHPAPNKKVYQPNYSEDKKRALAEKMDTLIEWGVLQRPELLGIVPEFVSPSMLVPKLEKDEYRFVTDFTSLNKFVRRYPTSSPTIKEAKIWLARKRMRIELDLSNYFYQSGVSRSDSQWLGVLHPYKGLHVYTVEPQGLKNSSEHAYSLLSLIYGDMCQEGKVTRVADSLYPLGDDIHELLENYEEVLRRAHQAGFSFKPSKVIIAPQKSVIFGWNVERGLWTPTDHVISALARAELPTTIKQLRGFLGSFKQLSDCIPRYATLLTSLEMMVGGRASAERIEWSKENVDIFEKAKEAAAKPQGVITPHPDDQLITYSDYSMSHDAVGGRMIVREKNKDGSTTDKLVGFFSAMLKHKSPWAPCDGEAAGIRLTLEHFAPLIRESNKTTIHYSDNKPCIDAWKRAQQGAFSASNKISTFLTGVSMLPVEIRHRPGSLMFTEDFASRNIKSCKEEKCQVCQFNGKWIQIVDKTNELRNLTLDEIRKGEKSMPFLQKKAWVSVQKEDSVHSKLKYLIRTSQGPEKKKTGGDNTVLKHLHTSYLAGDVTIDNDELVKIKTPNGYFDGYAISVPKHMYPGLVQALHIRMSHPSKGQMNALISRYFTCPGHSAIIDQVVDSCLQCLSMKQLPKEFNEMSPSPVADRMGQKFSLDIIERNKQKVLGVREDLTKYTILKIIPDQTADTLREAILSSVLPLMSHQGAIIRTDSAPAMQTLHQESQNPSSLLGLKGIKIELGQTLNPNKNPRAENLMKELQKEILRLDPKGNPVTETILTICQKNINDRVRHNKLSASEMLFKRDLMNHDELNIRDKEMAQDVEEVRMKERKVNRRVRKKKLKTSKEENFMIGENVFLKDKLNKTQARDLYTIMKFKDQSNEVVVRKYGVQFRDKSYVTKKENLMKIPNQALEEKEIHVEKVEKRNESESRPPRREAAKTALERILIRCVLCFKEEVKKIGNIPGNVPDLTDDETLEVINKALQQNNTSDISSQNISNTSDKDDNDYLSANSSADSCQLEVPSSPRTPEITTYIPPSDPTSPPIPSQSINFYPNPTQSLQTHPLSNPGLDTSKPSDHTEALENIQDSLPPTPPRPRRSVPPRDYKQLHSRGFYKK